MHVLFVLKHNLDNLYQCINHRLNAALYHSNPFCVYHWYGLTLILFEGEILERVITLLLVLMGATFLRRIFGNESGTGGENVNFGLEIDNFSVLTYELIDRL